MLNMDLRPFVYVLLATFNGERYLEEQLDSIQKQVEVRVKVIVNDDGSTDGTMQILESWQTMGLIESISTSRQVGPSAAFLNLVRNYHHSHPVAFSDQDDIWEPQKLKLLLGLLGDGDRPKLVFSRRSHIDEYGNYIGESKRLKNKQSWSNAVIQNVVYGNCMLLNVRGVKLLKKVDLNGMLHFDAYCYLIFSVLGQVIYCDEALVRYRIHPENTVGISNKFELRGFGTNLLDLHGQSYEVAKKLSQTTDLSSFQCSKLIHYFDELPNKLSFQRFIYILKGPLFRQNFAETILAKLILSIYLKTTH